jgi:hypothetical protein
VRQSLFHRCAVVSTLIVLALTLYWAGEISEMRAASRRRLIEHWPVACVFLVALAGNLTALMYGIARSLYLMETGRRLRHVSQQVETEAGVHRSLAQALDAHERES